MTDSTSQTPADPSATPSVFQRLGPAAWLGLVWAFLPAIGGFVLLARVGPVSAWLRDHADTGPFIYTAGFIVAAGLGLLPTYAQAFVGGWAFGPVVGTAAALTGFVGASLIGYAIARPIGRDRVEAELSRNARARAVRDALVGSGRLKTLGIVTLVRVPPNSPFSLTNLVLATTGVPLWIYITGTAIGMLPRTAVVVWIASQVARQFEGELTKEAIKGAQQPWMLGLSIGVAVVVLLLLVHIGNKAIEKVTGQSGADTRAEGGPES